MAKKALRGLRALYYASVTENTEASYKAGTSTRVPGLQELTKDDERDDFEEYADDDLYDTDNPYKYTNMDITLVELTPELQADMTGGAFEEEGNIYTAKSTDLAPEIAFGYAAVNASGGYRLFRHPVAKVMSIKIDHKTKGDKTESAVYQLSVRVIPRKIDKVHIQTSDVDADDDMDFIKVFPSLPISP